MIERSLGRTLDGEFIRDSVVYYILEPDGPLIARVDGEDTHCK